MFYKKKPQRNFIEFDSVVLSSEAILDRYTQTEYKQLNFLKKKKLKITSTPLSKENIYL